MYLPKSKYTKPKSTNGSEFIVKGTGEYYTGMYFETYKNQFFAGADPTANGVELQKVSNHGDTTAMLLAMGMGILGTAVAGFFVKKPTQSEKDKGVAKRYFVQDKNNNKIVETDKTTYLQTQKNVPNRNLAQVDWIIKGPAEDKMFGKYPFEGAESKNRKAILALESQMKGISTFITDYKYLVEDPAAVQKPIITTQTFIEKDASEKLDESRKARFDKRTDLIFPSASIWATEVQLVEVQLVEEQPTVITDGLVMYLDAGNTASYPGTGNIWTDLSGYSNISTLANGPTFDSQNGGSIVFDGTNDYASITGPNFFTINNPNPSQGDNSATFSVAPWYPIYDNFTCEFVCKPNNTATIIAQSNSGSPGTSGQRYITNNTKSTDGANNGACLVSIGTNTIQVFDHGDGYMPCLLSYTVDISTTVNVVVTVVDKQPSLYINGVYIKTGLTSTKTRVELAAKAPGVGANYYQPFSGNIGIFRYYSRVLSPIEIVQNYNATKGRY